MLYAVLINMAYSRLPSSATVLYTELLDRLLGGADVGAPQGTIVHKTVRGHRYAYLQLSALGKRKQLYLGPESQELTEMLRGLEQRWRDAEQLGQSTARLVAMLQQAGVLGPSGGSAKLLETLTAHGAFRAGGVLIGSHAFIAYGAMLGVRWSRAFRTDDLDLASDPRIGLAIGERTDLLDAVEHAVPPLTGIPGFDPKSPSTSFSSRGSEVRLDMLTPLVGKPTEKPVELASLGVHALPMRFLDYLIEQTAPAALVFGRGLLVHVPLPARFALHKLLVAGERRPHEANRANKDRAQASALLGVLGSDRPGDLELAWEALAERGRGWTKRIRAQAKLLEDEPRELLGQLSR